MACIRQSDLKFAHQIATTLDSGFIPVFSRTLLNMVALRAHRPFAQEVLPSLLRYYGLMCQSHDLPSTVLLAR